MSLSNFPKDLNRYQGKGTPFYYLIFEQGLWAIFFYRFGQTLILCRVPILAFFCRALAFLLMKLSECFCGISLPASLQCGPGLYCGHFGPIIIHPLAKLGSGCTLSPGVIIGTKGLGDAGVPVLGDHVYCGSGAKILGQIKIGHHVVIGANAVVLNDVADNSLAVGVPAQIKNLRK